MSGAMEAACEFSLTQANLKNGDANADITHTFYLFLASEHSLVLKEIKVPLWNHDTCNGALQAQFGPAYILPTTAICAGSEGKDACDVSMNIIRFCRCFDIKTCKS